MALNDAIGKIADLTEVLALGSRTKDLQDESKSLAGQGVVDDLPSFGGDKALHAMATERLAKNIGLVPALSIGGIKELLTGAGNVLGGGKFFDPSGFDVRDIEANLRGAGRAVQPSTAQPQTPGAGAGVQDILSALAGGGGNAQELSLLDALRGR